MTRRGVGGGVGRGAAWVGLVLGAFALGCSEESEAPDEVTASPRVEVVEAAAVGSVAGSAEATSEAEARLASEADARQRWGRLPMRFEENRGQHDARARYVARQRGLTLFATESALVMALQVPSDEVAEVPSVGGVMGATGPLNGAGPVVEGDAGARMPHEVEPAPLRQVGLRMWLEGGAEDAAIEASEPLQTRSNYFLGNDPDAWRTDIPNYGALRYREVRPGVDLLLRG
ncbi:MAG: hypothetical protein KC586_23875, partial [Myxococcales bacterium]|nr:hypothetical protein [Myxococcales bacterium]